LGGVKGEKLRKDGLDILGPVIAYRFGKFDLLMIPRVKAVDCREFAHRSIRLGLGFGLFGKEFFDLGNAAPYPGHNGYGHTIAASFVTRAVGALVGGLTFPGDSGIPLLKPLQRLAFLGR
jgi:hypothetical protein